jgi:hypothetical protein
MNTKDTGAQKRRTLSLPFGRDHQRGTRLKEPAAPSTIPVHELRRLVAAMID